MEGLLILHESATGRVAGLNTLVSTAEVQISEWNEVVAVRQLLAAAERRTSEAVARCDQLEWRHQSDITQLRRQHEAALEKARNDFEKALESTRKEAQAQNHTLRVRYTEVLAANERVEAQLALLARTAAVEQSTAATIDANLSAEIERLRVAAERSDARAMAAESVVSQLRGYVGMLQELLRKQEMAALNERETVERSNEEAFASTINRMRHRTSEQMAALKLHRQDLHARMQAASVRADRSAVTATELRAEAAALRHDRDVAVMRTGEAARDAELAALRAGAARDELDSAQRELADARRELHEQQVRAVSTERRLESAVADAAAREAATRDELASLQRQVAELSSAMERMRATMVFAVQEAAREGRQLADDDGADTAREAGRLRAALAASLDHSAALQRRVDEAEGVAVGLRAHARGLDMRLRSVQSQLAATVDVSSSSYLGHVSKGGGRGKGAHAAGDTASPRSGGALLASPRGATHKQPPQALPPLAAAAQSGGGRAVTPVSHTATPAAAVPATLTARPGSSE